MLKSELVKEIMRLRDEVEKSNEKHKKFMLEEYFADGNVIKDIVSIIPTCTETGIFANYYLIRFKDEKSIMKLRKNQLEEIFENMPLMIKEIEKWLEIHKFELEKHKELTKKTQMDSLINFISNEAKEIVNQEIKTTDEPIIVNSACICTPFRSDLVTVSTKKDEYFIVGKSDYKFNLNGKSYFIGNYVKINKDWYYLTTALYSDEVFEQLFDMSKKEYEFVMDWFKNLSLEQINFEPELTAISINNSKGAEILKEKISPMDKVLDYGCGTGRNMEYMHHDLGGEIHGTDTPKQLEKEVNKHDKLRDLGMTIEASELLENGFYDYVLNSFVLNVIESDDVKKSVLEDIHKKLKNNGEAIIEVRTKRDVESAKTKEPYKDGWKIKRGSKFTYQEAITKEKMIDLVTSVGLKIKEHIFNSNNHIVVACK